MRVLDISSVIAGPAAARYLGDFGADVIKVERPSGDGVRTMGWLDPRDDVTLWWKLVNRNKRCVALDLKDPDDLELVRALCDQADVLVENFRPGTMEKLGYGWDVLHPRYPRLIYAAASGFGHTGPYSRHPAYDMVVQGIGGIMSVTGEPGGGLTRVGMSIGDIGAGLYTTIAVNAALFDRAQTGEARKVDIGMFDCQLALLENAIMRYTTSGKIPGPMGARHPSITPFEAYKTQDGHLIIAAGNDALFVKLCHALERGDLAANPLFKTNDERNTHNRALAAELEKELAKNTTEGWMAVFEKAGIPCGPVNNIAQALAHPQAVARNMLVEADDKVAGKIKVAGNPLKMSGYPDPKTRPGAPELDADRAKILEELGLS
jgi:CoA:oxalate CoA-transferase